MFLNLSESYKAEFFGGEIMYNQLWNPFPYDESARERLEDNRTENDHPSDSSSASDDFDTEEGYSYEDYGCLWNFVEGTPLPTELYRRPTFMNAPEPWSLPTPKFDLVKEIAAKIVPTISKMGQWQYGGQNLIQYQPSIPARTQTFAELLMFFDKPEVTVTAPTPVPAPVVNHPTVVIPLTEAAIPVATPPLVFTSTHLEAETGIRPKYKLVQKPEPVLFITRPTSYAKAVTADL